ncbi:NAD(P)-binding domain-containing protein [Pseudomonas sp. R2.Fl]|nr:NAD(P)-binding domain-containing protein [Pseudomonas sp. R2.Fl]
MKRLGFIGTGAITRFFIEGLIASSRKNPIVVSPRSERTSKELAARFGTVRRASSNAEVAQDSDIVFLAMRPAQVEEALQGVEFLPDQILCSFVTGLFMPDLARIAPTSTVCRVLPLPAVAVRKGPIIHYPPVPEILHLIEGLGDVVLPESETELVALGGVSGFMSTFLELQAVLVDWLKGRGVSEEAAGLYTRSIFSGLSETALRSPAPLKELADDHETRGGLNERTRKYLLEHGWFDAVADALNSVQQVSRTDLK